jgi:DNA-binding transcriptional MerR regulator
MSATRTVGWKVGDLARRTGLTVRTLHHYDAIGLLRPSLRTASGHRLYTACDVARLQQVRSLRQLGFTLEEIRDCLRRPDFSPSELIARHVVRLKGQIALQQELCDRLEDLARFLDAAGEVSAEHFFRTIEVMTMIEGYYTPEQLEAIKRRREEVGEEAIRAAEREWPELIAKMKAEMEAGTDAADPRVQALARRWRELIEGFTGGDPGIAQALGRLWKEQGPTLAAQHGMDFDPRLFEYVGKANAVANQNVPE